MPTFSVSVMPGFSGVRGQLPPASSGIIGAHIATCSRAGRRRRYRHETEAEPDAIRREDGSWLLARWKPVDDMAELLKLALPRQRDYHTVAQRLIV